MSDGSIPPTVWRLQEGALPASTPATPSSTPRALRLAAPFSTSSQRAAPAHPDRDRGATIPRAMRSTPGPAPSEQAQERAGLFGAQGDHRVDAGGAPGRDERGRERDQDHQGGDGRIDKRIARADAEQD